MTRCFQITGLYHCCPLFPKFLQKVILEQLATYLDRNNLIHKHQYGFRKKHSTKYASLHIVDYLNYELDKNRTHQLGPRYEGQLMSDGGAYSPFRSILLVLTHDFIIICVYGPTGSDGHERKDADAALRTIFEPFEAKGVLYAWGPVQPANGPPTRTTSG